MKNKNKKSVKKSSKKSAVKAIKVKAITMEMLGALDVPEHEYDAYYVSRQQDNGLHYYVEAAPGPFNCWTNNWHQAQHLTSSQAKEVIKANKAQGIPASAHLLTDLLFNALQDLSVFLWGERFEGEFDLPSMREEIERLQTVEYQHSQLKEATAKVQNTLRAFVLDDFAA